MKRDERIGIRYCGGCNPRYDRVRTADRLAALFPDRQFVPAESGVPYTAVVVICGCPNRCADASFPDVPSGRILYLADKDDLFDAQDSLWAILRGKETLSLSRADVMRILPHRSPMLLVDSVSALVPGIRIAASFTVPGNSAILRGHFPSYPVLPGVLSTEAVAQAADILLMTLDCYRGKIPLLAEIREARFRRKILPGDTPELRVSLLEEQRERGCALCGGLVFVRGELAAEAKVRLAMRDQ